MTKKQQNNGDVKKSKALVKQEYGQEEKERISHYEKRSKKEPAKFKKEGGSDAAGIEVLDYNKKLTLVKLMESLGTVDPGLQNHLLNQVVNTFAFHASSKEVDDDTIEGCFNNSVALLQGIAPRDEIEAMLAIQMIGTNNLAMEALKTAMIHEQTFKGQEAHVNYATKMLRTFTAQMEALKRYRTGGEQKMTIEHIHINEGGQAIVGNIKTTRGDKDKNSG